MPETKRRSARAKQPSLKVEQQQLIALWLPLELKIQNLTGEAPDLSTFRDDVTRRALLHRLFEEREGGDLQAQVVIESFGQVLQLYGDRTQRFLEQGGYGHTEAEAKALEELSGNSEFLLRANSYATAFQNWLVAFIARGEDIGFSGGRDNQLHSIELPTSIQRANDYVIQTSQEAIALLTSICSGKTGKHWSSDVQDGTRTYERKDTNHRVQLRLLEEERDGGLTTIALESMTRELDADGMFAVLYVSRLLAPQSPLPRNALAYDWIELDDVMAKIGWKPRTSAERLEMRRAVWNYLRFCARANLSGERSTTYRDPDSRKEIPTRIEGPIWRFMKEEKPIQPSLFAEEDVPLRVQIAVSPEWTRLTTSPLLAQFLPMGELLGQIPPDKPSGAWARALGMALSGFWRRKPREALDGSLQLARGELLTSYEPKIALPEEILAGKNPRRALEYWRGALQLLCEVGFVAKEGEAIRTEAEMLAAQSRKGWQSQWLGEKVDLRPGAKMRDAVRMCSNNLPAARPRNLKALQRKTARNPKTDEV